MHKQIRVLVQSPIIFFIYFRQLGNTATKTSSYHPQTVELVERFNQMVKSMLRKFVADTGCDWDKWLPFILFAYREVPKASSGTVSVIVVTHFSKQASRQVTRSV